MEKRTERIYIKIFPSVKEGAKRLAENEGRSLSNYIETLLTREIERTKNETGGD
ncbi:MAG: hypothetical protein ACOYI4_09515 [Christensenellales bacterium]|jgi:hypothetical protein